MKATTTLSAFIAAIELAQATVYLAGDSTMAKSGANDGVTDGSSTNFILPNPLSRLLANSSHQAGASQITNTLPLRLMILHLAQRFRIDGETFIP